jgi:hypothetical protein
MRDFAHTVRIFTQHRNENRLAFALQYNAKRSKEKFMENIFRDRLFERDADEVTRDVIAEP